MIKNFVPRLYQQTILSTAVRVNTLVVLPTGMGKTAIAFLLAAQRFKQYPSSKVLLLSPTKPLCEQHLKTFQENLDLKEQVLFSGAVSPAKREQLWGSAKVIISTPQGLENDVVSERIDFSQVSLLVFDEAHHAVGDYSYVWLAKQYQRMASFPRILALTASPGTDLEKIREVCNNLFIERVEVRSPEDLDVKPYIQEVDTEYIKVAFPAELAQARKFLKDCYDSKIVDMRKFGYVRGSVVNKSDLLSLQKQLFVKMKDKDFLVLKTISVLAEAMKVQHALELLETQSVFSSKKYLDRLKKESLTTKVKAVKNLVADPNFKSASFIVDSLVAQNIQHPKFTALLKFISNELLNNKDVKIMVFSQFRDTAVEIVQGINQLKLASSKLFVGQMKKAGTGLSQKEQKAVLEQFRNDEFNVLVCTSVGEEGLDIPAVDLVAFFEPIPSAIRHIQRRGRTGRQKKGRVVIFLTKGTRDEGYRWSAHYKERRMYATLDKIKKEFILKPQTSISNYIPVNKKVQIVVDHREKSSSIVKELIELGISVKIQTLEIGDYLCSSSVAVELKSVRDFVASIIDGRLLEQLKKLKTVVKKPLIIIEGSEDLFSVRNVHPNAIRGMLATISVSYGIPLIQTGGGKESAALLAVIARREQEKDRDFSHHSYKPLSDEGQQEFVISSFPSIGLVHARNLLAHFGSIHKILNASVLELQQVEGIGSVLAKRFKELIDRSYSR